MTRTESILVGLVLGVACPLLTFVAFWWTTAVVHMSLPQVPVEAVITAALTGLVVGAILDVVYLKRWIKRFYTANVWLLASIYLALCAVAVAFFMGLPAGTFLLGIGSGVYMGRRQCQARADSLSAAATLRKTALFAALVTTAAALPIGVLALDDQGVVDFVGTFLGIGQAGLRGFRGLALVGALCLVLFVAQYWCTRIAGKLSLAIGRKET